MSTIKLFSILGHEMDEEPSSFENICRTCMSQDKCMKSLFSVHISDTELVRVVDFIRRMTSIKIAKGDGLPQKLCVGCIETICKAYTFAQLCISSDNLLRLQRKRIALQNIQNEIFGDSEEDELPQHADISENKIAVEQIQADSNVISSALESNNGENKKHLCTTTNDNQLNIDVEGIQRLQFGKLMYDNDFEIVQEQEVVTDSAENEKGNEEKVALRDFTKLRKNHNFVCVECPESFTTKIKLEKHEILHDSSRPHKCSECRKTFLQKRNLAVHMRSHTNVDEKQYSCTICNKKFTYEYLLKQHSFKHKDEKPYPCSLCEKGCLTAESLRRHMKTHAENYEKKKHACSVCSKEFPYPSFLAEHMKNHTGEKPFLCSICGRGFRQSGALEYHIRSHTGFRPYKCHICNNNFSSRGVLRVHMRRHTDERPYVCDICGMAFRQSTDMRSHRRTHTGDKRVLCTVCGKRMSTTGQLTVHLRSHTGEKPFGCEFCPKAFTTRTMLVKHRRIHTGERPYVCNICGRAFNQSSTLKTHGMTHIKNNTVKTNTELIIEEEMLFEVKTENAAKRQCQEDTTIVKKENLPSPII